MSKINGTNATGADTDQTVQLVRGRNSLMRRMAHFLPCGELKSVPLTKRRHNKKPAIGEKMMMMMKHNKHF